MERQVAIIFFGVKPMSLIHLNHYILKRRLGLNRHSLLVILTAVVYSGGLAGCGDTYNVSPPPAGPGPLTIATLPTPERYGQPTLCTVVGGSGGRHPIHGVSQADPQPYRQASSLNATTGTIVGTPTAPGTTTPIFRLQDSSHRLRPYKNR